MSELIPPKRKKYASAYGKWESIKFLWKNVRVSRKNPGKVQFIPKNITLNHIEPKYTLVFVGDIMDLGGRYLEIDPELTEFIQNSDFFIGNFEATITDAPYRGVDQRHDKKIIQGLKILYKPEKTFLSIANNHAGDFGQEIFFNSLKLLKKEGFNIFGTKEEPTTDINSNIRFLSVSMWMNRQADFITRFEDIDFIPLDGKTMNIISPHWGYDLELYPRKFVIKLGNELIQKFDAIIGHHSHCPQPITSYPALNGNPSKLIAYSLGDFCFGKLLKKHFYNYNYGIVLKVKIGKNENGNWTIGDLIWKFTKCEKKEEDTMRVKLIDSNPYFKL